MPPIVHEVLRSPGQPLDLNTRAFMEPRFGHDFSGVRVHTDARAARSAKAVNALAYTVGNDIAFDKGQYSPETNEGKGILAHELTHVLQQKTYQKPMQTKLSISESANAAERQADDTADAVVFGIRKVPNSFAPAGPSIQRVCGVAAIGTRAECDDQDPIFVTGHPFFKFNVSCDDFASGEEANLRSTAATLPASGSVEVHGYASVDGNATFNENLSCARALKAQTVLTSAGITAGRISIVKHGPTPGPTADRRSVVISTTAAPGPTPTPTPTPAPAVSGSCGQPRSMDKLTSGAFLGGLTMDSYYPNLAGRGFYNHPGTAGTFDTGSRAGANIQLYGVIPSPCLPSQFHLEQTISRTRFRINGVAHPREGENADDIAKSGQDASRAPFRQEFLGGGTAPLGYIISMADPPSTAYNSTSNIEHDRDFVTSLVGPSGRQSVTWSLSTRISGGAVTSNALT